MTQKKVCPMMSSGRELMPCVEERCPWWISKDGTSRPTCSVSILAVAMVNKE